MSEEYAQFVAGAEHPALTTFRVAVAQLQQRQLELADLEQAVKDKKAEIADIAEMQLPVLVESIGLGDELPLANGTKLVIKREHGASPLKDNREECWDWMVGNGHGHLVKRAFGMSFGKGEEKDAANLRRVLEANEISFSEERGVHYQTLSKFVRDAEGRGDEIPEELFGVFRTAVAKITGKPKKHFPGE